MITIIIWQAIDSIYLFECGINANVSQKKKNENKFLLVFMGEMHKM